MTRISQLIAVVGGVKSDVTAQISRLMEDITKPDLVAGISRTYRARFEETDQGPAATALAAVVGSAAVTRPPEEFQRVRVTALDTLDVMEKLLTRLFDVTRTLDQANAGASADVRLPDGTILWTGVPTSHLLYLERELADLHEKVNRFPELPQEDTWTTEGTERGVSKTAPVEVASTKKVPFNHVRTEKKSFYPDGKVSQVEPQVDVLTRDEVVGYKTTVSFSGALDPRRKRLLLDRLTQVREAVKFAREEANAAQVTDVKEGKRFFDWWLRS
jgi:hypothetical protein